MPLQVVCRRTASAIGLLDFLTSRLLGSLTSCHPSRYFQKSFVSTPSVVSESASASIPTVGRADLRPQNIRDAVIRLAGNSQDGIQTAGAMLARLAGRSDQEVMTYMTIPSTISGGPSIFQVRIGTGEVLSAGDEADFLVAFYQHSYEDHIALRFGSGSTRSG